MKYTIEGFDQKTAIEYGLDVTDLTILRWFVDFMHSNRISKVMHDGKEYCWIKYDGLLTDMPILGIQKKMLAIRLKKLVDAGVLIHATKKVGGTFSLYAIGDNYTNLINSYSSTKTEGVGNKLDTVGNEFTTGSQNISQGVGNKLDTPSEINFPPKDYSTKKDSSTKENSSTKKIKKEKETFSPEQMIDEADLPLPIKMKVKEWVVYKSERKESYQVTGFKSFLTQLKNNVDKYGDVAVCELITECMSRGWKGIIYDKLKNKESYDNRGGIVEDGRIRENAKNVTEKAVELGLGDGDEQFPFR